MTNKEYNLSILKLIKANSSQQINELDSHLLKTANDDELNLYDEGVEVGEIEEVKKPVTKKEKPELQRRIDTRPQQIKDEREQILQPSSVMNQFDSFYADLFGQNKSSPKQEQEVKKQVQLSDYDKSFLQITNNLSKKSLSNIDIQNIIEELKSDIYITQKTDNEDDSDKPIEEKLLNSYIKWLNERFLQVFKETNASDIKEKFLAAIEQYKRQIIDQGFGYDEGVGLKSKYKLMENLFFVYTSMCYAVGVKKPYNVRDFFQLYGAKRKTEQRFSDKEIEKFEKFFYYQGGQNNIPITNAYKTKRRYFNLKNWFQSFLGNAQESEQPLAVLNYYKDYPQIYDMVQDQLEESNLPSNKGKQYQGLSNAQIKNILNTYRVINDVVETSSGVVVPAKLTPAQQAKIDKKREKEQDMDELEAIDILYNRPKEKKRKLDQLSKLLDVTPSSDAIDLDAIDLDAILEKKAKTLLKQLYKKAEEDVLPSDNIINLDDIDDSSLNLFPLSSNSAPIEDESFEVLDNLEDLEEISLPETTPSSSAISLDNIEDKAIQNEVKKPEAKKTKKNEGLNLSNKVNETTKQLMGIFEKVPNFNPKTKNGQDIIKRVLIISTSQWMRRYAEKTNTSVSLVAEELFQEIIDFLPHQNFAAINDLETLAFITAIKSVMEYYFEMGL